MALATATIPLAPVPWCAQIDGSASARTLPVGSRSTGRAPRCVLPAKPAEPTTGLTGPYRRIVRACGGKRGRRSTSVVRRRSRRLGTAFCHLPAPLWANTFGPTRPRTARRAANRRFKRAWSKPASHNSECLPPRARWEGGDLPDLPGRPPLPANSGEAKRLRTATRPAISTEVQPLRGRA